ncbi:hypothetical protein MCOR25_008859 [Pyricularia grisea]|nr:hypothetical protein MCOR25_008859 [Pyricularia grisea]
MLAYLSVPSRAGEESVSTCQPSEQSGAAQGAAPEPEKHGTCRHPVTATRRPLLLKKQQNDETFIGNTSERRGKGGDKKKKTQSPALSYQKYAPNPTKSCKSLKYLSITLLPEFKGTLIGVDLHITPARSWYKTLENQAPS